MSLTNPWALLWAGLAVPIVILYILKIRLRRVPVSTVMFWQRIYEEKQPRSLWRRLRHLISLLLQLLFLLLLVLALTDPFFNWQNRQARRLVLIVDNSASMRATDVQPSRLVQAIRDARGLISSLRNQDEMAIVTAGVQPQVVCGLTGHKRTLREALSEVRATDGPTRVAPAVALARRLLGEATTGRIVILSDGCFPAARELAQMDDVVWRSVGQSSDNVGITQFQVRRSLLDPVGFQLLAEVVNFSDRPVETRLELALETRLIDVAPVNLEPRGSHSLVLQKTSAAGGELLARLDRSDSLMADNEARAILPPTVRQRVVLVSQGNLFLQRVFEANALVDLTVVEQAPANPPADAVLVLHRTVPDPVPAGNVFVVQPTNSTDLWDLQEPLENPIVAKQDSQSPLMASVRLDNVLMPEACRLELKETATVLAQALTDDPLYFTIERPTGKLIVLSVNLDRCDLPLRTAFPILATNALRWFVGEKGELRQAYASGAVADVTLAKSNPPAQAASAGADPALWLQSPGGRTTPLRATGGAVTVGPLDRCGIWRVLQKTEQSEADQILARVACNLANREESDLLIERPLRAKQTELSGGLSARPFWFYLMAIAWLLTTTEWCLYHRRKIS